MTSISSEFVTTKSVQAFAIPTNTFTRALPAAQTLNSRGEMLRSPESDTQHAANNPEKVLTINATSKNDQTHSQAFCVFMPSSRATDSRGDNAIVQSSCAEQ